MNEKHTMRTTSTNTNILRFETSEKLVTKLIPNPAYKPLTIHQAMMRKRLLNPAPLASEFIEAEVSELAISVSLAISPEHGLGYLYAPTEYDSNLAIIFRETLKSAHTAWQAVNTTAAAVTATGNLTEKPEKPTTYLPSIEAWRKITSPRAKMVALRLAISNAPYAEHVVWEVTDPNNRHNKLKLDADQVYAVCLALEGKSFVLTGAAGTGKTLTEQAIALAMYEAHWEVRAGRMYRIPMWKQGKDDDDSASIFAPAIWIGAFTNKAVSVLSRKIQANPELVYRGFGGNLCSIHNLLEFKPFEVWSELQQKEVRRFFPTRTATYPLRDLPVAVIDEASMVGVSEDGDLNKCQIGDYFLDALVAGKTQLILVGDINQLPPVGGKSLLSYGLKSLPVHELTIIHRQAEESPIISAAHKLLNGELPDHDIVNHDTGDAYYFRPWRPELAIKFEYALQAYDFITAGLPHWVARGEYNPEEDIFLLPMYKEDNKDVLRRKEKARRAGKLVEGKNAKGRAATVQYFLSAKHVNAQIATFLADHNATKEVYTVFAGFDKHYLAEGDRVLVNKTEGKVVEIRRNYNYKGQSYEAASIYRDYFGKMTRNGYKEVTSYYTDDAAFDADSFNLDSGDIDQLFVDMKIAEAKLNSEEEYESRAASHEIICELDSGETVTLNTAGQLHPQVFQLGYAMTVHKAQGSEWPNVFVFLHQSHATMISRELLYTAITRARNKVFLFGHKEMYERSAERARIKGKSLAEKIAWFTKECRAIDLSKLR